MEYEVMKKGDGLAFFESGKIEISVRFENLAGKFYDIIYYGGDVFYGTVDSNDFQIDFTADAGKIIVVKVGEYNFIVKASDGIYIFEHGNGRVVIYIGEVDIN